MSRKGQNCWLSTTQPGHLCYGRGPHDTRAGCLLYPMDLTPMLSKQINRRMKITISSGTKGVSSFLNVSSVRTNNSRSLSMTLRNIILLYPYNNPVKEVRWTHCPILRTRSRCTGARGEELILFTLHSHPYEHVKSWAEQASSWCRTITMNSACRQLRGTFPHQCQGYITKGFPTARQLMRKEQRK